MASEDIQVDKSLLRICIEVACQSRDSVERWRRQRRTLERLPTHLAEALLHRLLDRRLLFPSLLEVFKLNVEQIDLKGENSVDAEWMAYLGAFKYLRSLNMADCYRITNSALWPITGMTSLMELDLSRCMKVSDAGVKHLLSIPHLEKLCISETGVTADGVKLLASLTNLSTLDLGGLHVTDVALSSLQVLTKLEYLDLWGSEISDKGAMTLVKLPKLSFLNLAWTRVTILPNLKSLGCLNMSNCTIHSVIEDNGQRAPLRKFIAHGVSFRDAGEVFSYIDIGSLSSLDLSNTSLNVFGFLHHMHNLRHLDLSLSMIEDDAVELISCIGANLRHLNLSNTRISSTGVGSLAGHVPNLQVISLSHTSIDDVAVAHISMMPSLEVVDLSNTHIKGFTHLPGSDQDEVLSLLALQNLDHLKELDLSGTRITDSALNPLSSFQELSHLSLMNTSVTDDCLPHLSSIKNLVDLSIRDALLTNSALHSFNPPATLKVLDLQGCWLLTGDALMLFCENHPRLEVRHELLPRPSVVGANPDRSASPSQALSQSSKSKQRGVQSPISPSLFKEDILDQRIKYSREELLSLQHSTWLFSPHNAELYEIRTQASELRLR
ncbi:hypothetical protein Ancab_015459 [Ancistrocladus abbreviatus]